ncbi:DUF4118 domain-containing protein [Rhizobium sp. YTU87027]|uniref:DUF4118 domain-containing protein n=1 Tax=Rhizobium sp. YTU87027 TaxID=3417741 RepID=UPI003D692384
MADVESKLEPEVTTMPVTDPLPDSRPWEASALVGYLASFTMTAIAAVVAVGIDRGLTIPNVSLVFVVPVIVAGVSFGFGPSLCSAVLGALAYNFFLTEPRYTLVVDDPANIWAICLLFLVGLIVSGIAFTSRRRAADAALLRRQATVLQAYSRDVVAADSTNTLISVTSQTLAALFQVPATVMLVAEGKVISVKSVGGLQPEEADFEAARLSLEVGTVARAGVYPALGSRFDFWPVATGEGWGAVIGLAFDPSNRPSAPETSIDIVGSVLALALSRLRSPVGRDARSKP